MGALKKPTCSPAPQPKKSTPERDNMIQKAEIERMKKLLSEKIKNPELIIVPIPIVCIGRLLAFITSISANA